MLNEHENDSNTMNNSGTENPNITQGEQQNVSAEPAEAKAEAAPQGEISVIRSETAAAQPVAGYNYFENTKSVNDATYRWNYTADTANKKNEPAKKTKKKSGTALRVWAIAMAAVFMFTAVSLGATLVERMNGGSQNTLNQNNAVISNSDAVESSRTAVKSQQLAAGLNEKLTTPDIIKKVKPSVVCIETEIVATVFGRKMTSTGVGTGFIITEDGYIATNHHVIENSSKITVTMSNGNKYDATLIGSHDVSDLAVIKINAKNLPAADLGDSDALQEGEDVVAIGTPAGAEFAGTTTKGIVSAINRNVQIDSERGYSSKTMTLIQTDASINPGNSGGPLVNDKGQVVGINTMKLSSGYEGMGFSLPINGAIPIINEIIKTGTVTDSANSFVTVTTTTKLGLHGLNLTEEEAAANKVPQGYEINEIDSDGPCANIGMVAGDIVIKFNGVTVKSSQEIAVEKNKCKVGDEVTLTIYRNGKEIDFKVTLAKAD